MRPKCRVISSPRSGIPPGVISYLPSDGPVFGDSVTGSPHFAAVNFTGSVPTFKYLWQKTAQNLDRYVTYPRLIGGEQLRNVFSGRWTSGEAQKGKDGAKVSLYTYLPCSPLRLSGVSVWS